MIDKSLGGEPSGNALSDGVGGAFHLRECHPLRPRERMVVLLAEDRQDFIGDAIEFVVGGFCEGHGEFGGVR